MDSTESKDGTLGAEFLRHGETQAGPQTGVSTRLTPESRPSENPIEHDSAVYRTLLESTKAIPWKIDWRTMTFAYIGPQIEALLGWAPSSWKTVQDWVDRMHPDDRNQVVEFCVSQSKAGVDHEADYRALTSQGDYSPHKQAVTASFGVGTIIPSHQTDSIAFINLVDAQLYHAKDNGRNRIAAVDRAIMGGDAFKSHSR